LHTEKICELKISYINLAYVIKPIAIWPQFKFQLIPARNVYIFAFKQFSSFINRSSWIEHRDDRYISEKEPQKNHSS